MSEHFISEPGLAARAWQSVSDFFSKRLSIRSKNVANRSGKLGTLWRHGDVFVAAVDAVPGDARSLPHCVLAEGEITGHSHRIQETDVASMFEDSAGVRFLKIDAESATLIHQEHRAISLPKGTYRVWIQREYTPEEIRRVID